MRATKWSRDDFRKKIIFFLGFGIKVFHLKEFFFYMDQFLGSPKGDRFVTILYYRPKDSRWTR